MLWHDGNILPSTNAFFRFSFGLMFVLQIHLTLYNLFITVVLSFSVPGIYVSKVQANAIATRYTCVDSEVAESSRRKDLSMSTCLSQRKFTQ